MESSTYAKLLYVKQNLEEVYIEFFISSHSMPYGKQRITVQNTRQVSVLASLSLSIEDTMR
jgi:hypothetical protein